MRKSTRVVSAIAIVVTTGSLMSVVQANPAPPDRTPVKVEQTWRDNTYSAGSPNWGHDTIYNLKVIDKEGAHYGLGKPDEAFGSVILNQDNYIKSALQDQNVPGTPNGPSNPWPECATFQDENSTYLTWDTGIDTFWYSFRQHWHDTRVSDNYRFRLNVHTVTHYQGGVTRNY